MLSRELEVFELGTKIQSQVQEEMDKSQREYFLRQQLKAIQEELGETDEQQAEIAELRAQVEEASLPEEADKQARRELDRLSKLPPAAAEYGVIRTYLEWMLSLPWTRDDRGRPRPEDGAAHPRRGPLRPRQGQGADRRAPRRPEADQQALRPDPRASSALPASARRRWASRSRGPSGASSSASRSAASATRRRSAATGAPTSARCRARSSAHSGTPGRRTRSS